MSTTIKDAETGQLAKVDTEKRLWTKSTTEDDHHHATEEGDAYNINTGTINLTSGDESAVLYFKNNEAQPYYLRAIAIGFSPSTGGVSTEIPIITVIKNPTAGTIIDDATSVDINANRNFGSSKTLSSSLAYKGAEAKTFTDGDDHLLFYQAANGRLFAAIGEFLQKGNSVGIKIEPQTSNTSMNCYAALIGHLEEIV